MIVEKREKYENMANEQNLKKFSKEYQPPPENKRGPKRKTLVKKVMNLQGVNWNDAEKIVEKNILELLNSRNKKDRIFATKNFAEFIKPKKREHTGDIKSQVVVNIKYGND